ncbi:MAG: hypothetical protein WA431_04175 [Candidatus Cybelea sp.]
MNSVPVLRTISGVLLGLLIIVSGLLVSKVSPPKEGHDGNPSGLDITMKGNIGLYQRGDFDRLSCPAPNSPCPVQVALHYLSRPAPTCPPGKSGVSECTPPPANNIRVLPTCGSNQVCLSANPNDTSYFDSNATPLHVEIQDDDNGWRPFDTNGQFVLIVNSGNERLKAKTK